MEELPAKVRKTVKEQIEVFKEVSGGVCSSNITRNI